MFDYQPRLGGATGGDTKIFCTTPGCSGWIWSSRRKVSHCRQCMAPIDWTSVSKGGPAGHKGQAKSTSGKGAHQQFLGGVPQDGWPPLVSGSQYSQFGWMPPVGFWSKGKGKFGQPLFPGPQWGKGKGKGQTQPPSTTWQAKGNFSKGQGGSADSGACTAGGSDGDRKKAEQQVALAQQEVQFYRRMEQRGMLAPNSRQMRESQERLRKAKLHELGSRSLPQQAKSLRDKLQSLEIKLSQQRLEASRITDEFVTLEERHRVLAASHVELKKERQDIKARLDLVEHSATKELPDGSWKQAKGTGPMDEVFMQFQSQLASLFPDLDKAQSEALQTALGNAYKTADHIQATKLHHRPEQPKRVRTGGKGEVLSGPRHFPMEALQEEEQSSRSGAGAQPQHDDDGYGNFDVHSLLRYPPPSMSATDTQNGEEGPIEDFIEGDPELWRQKRARDERDLDDMEDDDEGDDGDDDDHDGLGEDDGVGTERDDHDDTRSQQSEATHLSRTPIRGTLDEARMAAKAKLPNADVFRRSWEPEESSLSLARRSRSPTSRMGDPAKESSDGGKGSHSKSGS